MRRFAPIIPLLMAGACSAPYVGPEPSLAPRPVEAIDPRVPISDKVPSGPVDPELAVKLDELVGRARAGTPLFDTQLADAERQAAAAGPMASESWVVAQQALSLLIEQFGVTTRVAAEIDSLAASRVESQRWIQPADQKAIMAAAAEVADISEPQAAAIARLQELLAR